jgi:SAM-dependent methyltransferase
MSTPRIHEMADRGFGQNAGDYERARPSYPPDAVRFLVDQLGLGPGRTVVDVGAGTGKLTRLLVDSGATIIAVEPVAAMRTQLTKRLPGVTVADATAGNLPLESGSVDGIICAQAFHWFATASTLEEFARVLPPAGPLGLVWNLRDNSVPWIQAFTELLRPYEGDRPDHNRGEWRRVFEGDGPFEPLTTTSFRHEQPMTPDLLVGRAASMSFVGALDDDVRSVLLERVRRLGRAQGPSFTMGYRTDVHITRRRPARS